MGTARTPRLTDAVDGTAAPPCALADASLALFIHSRPCLSGRDTTQSFAVGHDEQAMLDVNSRAFTDLPDQGTWTMDDLQQRQGEDWFDPGGLLMAWLDEPSHPSNGARSLADSTGRRFTDLPISMIRWTTPGRVRVALAQASMGTARRRGLRLGRGSTLARFRSVEPSPSPVFTTFGDGGSTRSCCMWTLPTFRLFACMRLGFVRWDTDIMYRTPRS